MGARRFACAALLAAWLIPACGGGGGASAPLAVLALDSIEVTTQGRGPLAPFGTTLGGDEAVLEGAGFASGLTVRFGSRAATVVQVSGTRVVVTTPPGPEGFAAVVVRNPDGAESSLAAEFQYVAPPEATVLVALDGPTAGEPRAPIAGGTEIRLTGANLKPGVTVRLGTTAVAVRRDDATTLRFDAPSVDGQQSVDVVVTNPEGLSATLVRGLAYTQEFSLAPAGDALSLARANHLLRRAGFGAPPEVAERAVSDGLAATLDRLLSFTNDAAVEGAALAIYGARVPPEANIANRTNQQWWLHLLQKNPNPFQERLAWFLHDHFATSGRGFNTDFTWTLHTQVQLFRRFALQPSDRTADGRPGLGYDWRALLVEVCKDRAMLEWLDGRVSTARAPNENFARELWELFMLGEGNGYTEADIQEAARAFTGFFWYRTGGRTESDELDVRYRPARHDTGEKTFLGATGRFGYDSVSPFFETDPSTGATDPGQETDPADEEGVVSVTLRQRPVEASRFVCRKLAEFFLYDDVHDVVVDELAADLRRAGPNQWNLQPVLRRILRSKAMFSTRAMKGKVKNPVEFSLGFLRTTGIDLSSNAATATRRLYDRLTAMGQVPLDPPDVNGWPTGTAWLAAQSMVERYNFLNFSVQQLESVPTQIEPLLPPAGRRAPTELVDHLAGVLDVRLSGTARARAIEYVTSRLDGDQQVPAPFDPNDPDQLKNKTRGLLWILAQYHDAHQD